MKIVPLVAMSIICLTLAAQAPSREPAASAADGGVEAAVQRVVADLAKRRNVASDEIKTLRAEAVVWRDTSMGCGTPTGSYAQIDVEGYEIVLEHSGHRFDYRVRKDGEFVLCEALPRPRG